MLFAPTMRYNYLSRMKKYILLLFFSLSTFYADAQVKTLTQVFIKAVPIDTAKYKITYQMKFYIIKGDSMEEDLRIIEIGNHTVKDYSKIEYTYDSLATSQYKKGVRQYKLCPIQVFPYEIYNQQNHKQNLIVYRAINNMGNFQYEEPMPKMKWTLEPTEHKTVLGYNCNKATTTYAGRNYIAWYTLDIPLHAGPFKFTGLPGLIMQVEDSEHKYYWEAKGIEKVNTPIFYHCYLYPKLTKTTRQKTRELMDKMFTSPIVMYKIMTGNPTMRQNKDGTWREVGKADDHSIDYERIEKE